MNRALIRRLLNEYLDGEIGLADKAELEQLMASDPEVRQQYRQLRQIGLLLGGIPEVNVHPQGFRMRMADALQARRTVITPQRAFAAAMLVALLVLTLSFGLLVFQQKMLGTRSGLPVATQEAAVAPASQDYVVALDTNVSADQFFSRLLVEHELGMIDPAAVGAVVQQTTVYEGTTCTGNSLAPLKLAQPVHYVKLTVTPSVAVQISKVAEELTGRPMPLNVYSSAGRISLEDYLRLHQGQKTLALQLKFR